MPCTTILVGKNASYDGSTLVARNEDSSNGVFEPKRMRVVHPDEQPRVYTSVLSHLTVELPDNPMRYTSVPDVVPGHGIWAEATVLDHGYYLCMQRVFAQPDDIVRTEKK